MLTQPPIIQQGDNREQETKMETAVKHVVVLCGPRLPNICFSPVNVWFGPAASTHLLWQYCSQRQPSADCYGLLLDEGLKERKKKCATAGKRGWAEWFKGHSCQRVLVQTPGTFYIICRSYRTSSQMSCTTKKSSPYTIDPNNKNVITITFVTGPHGSLANPFIVILNFSTKKTKKHIHSTWFHSGFFFIRSHLPPTMQQHSHHWEPTQNQQDEF